MRIGLLNESNALPHESDTVLKTVTTTTLILLLFLATIAFAQKSKPNGPDESVDENWAPKKELMKHLQEPVKLDSVSLCPPNDFVRTKHPQAETYKKAGIGVGVWNKEPGNGIPSLLVIMLPYSEKEPWNGEKFVGGFRNSVVRKWKNVKTSKIIKGRLHDATAVRTQYRGMTADGTEVAGFIVAFNDSQGTVAITCVTVRNENSNELLTIMLNSALTTQRVRKGH